MSVNKIILIGHLGNDPVVNKLTSGDSATSFSLATSEKYPNKQTGEMIENTIWFNCEAYGKTADVIGQYVKKGHKLYVEGKLVENNYTDKNGAVNKGFKVRISGFDFLESSKSAGQPQAPQANAPAPASSPAPAMAQTPAEPVYAGSDDLPF
jgi:single-strand DNA-binding protein